MQITGINIPPFPAPFYKGEMVTFGFPYTNQLNLSRSRFKQNCFSAELLTGAVYEVSHEWALGPELCDMWTSSDVLCCTASILHLVAIALDRYVDELIHKMKKGNSSYLIEKEKNQSPKIF